MLQDYRQISSPLCCVIKAVKRRRKETRCLPCWTWSHLEDDRQQRFKIHCTVCNILTLNTSQVVRGMATFWFFFFYILVYICRHRSHLTHKHKFILITNIDYSDITTASLVFFLCFMCHKCTFYRHLFLNASRRSSRVSKQSRAAACAKASTDKDIPGFQFSLNRHLITAGHPFWPKSNFFVTNTFQVCWGRNWQFEYFSQNAVYFLPENI